MVLLDNDDNQGKLALYLGISQQTLSKKLNERHGSEFSQTEIKMIKEKYNLTAEQVDNIFFKQLVS